MTADDDEKAHRAPIGIVAHRAPLQGIPFASSLIDHYSTSQTALTDSYYCP